MLVNPDSLSLTEELSHFSSNWRILNMGVLWLKCLLGKFSKSQRDSLEIVLENDKTMMANDFSDLDKGSTVRMEKSGNSKDILEVIRNSQTKVWPGGEKQGHSWRQAAQVWEGWHGGAQFRLVPVRLNLQMNLGVSWYMDCCKGVLWMTQNLPRTWCWGPKSTKMQ